VIDGSLDFTSGAETRTLHAGGWSVAGPDVAHGITAGPAGARFLAILVPRRGAAEVPIIDTPTHLEPPQ
jgi:quercetin dioxygenase-like cupin family protein